MSTQRDNVACGRLAQVLPGEANSNTVNTMLCNRSCRVARTLVLHVSYEVPVNHGESTGGMMHLCDISLSYVQFVGAACSGRRLPKVPPPCCIPDAIILRDRPLGHLWRAAYTPGNKPALMSLAVYKCDRHTTAHTNEPACDNPISVKPVWFIPDSALGCATVSCLPYAMLRIYLKLQR